jgi:cysteine-rich repeat protein
VRALEFQPRSLLLWGLCAALWAAPATAETFPFHCVTNNNPSDCATAEAQITLDVTDPVVGDDQVQMTFSNAGPQSSSLTAVYFDDGVITSIAVSSSTSPGVHFTAGSASPPDLPGGDLLDPPFQTTENLAADADPSPSENGVNPGEVLVLDVNVTAGSTLQDVLDQLRSGELRVGIKVQAFDGGGSESLVTPWCGDGLTDAPEECDDDNNTDCDGCSATCELEVCGNGRIDCDLDTGVDEQCDDGNTTAGDCCSPSCDFEPPSTECRPSAGVCDAPELCTGSSGTCPPDVFLPSSTECRPSAGVCDLAEFCTGVGPSCPPDAKSTAECRASAGVCDVAELCDGVSDDCPPDGFKPPTTECRPACGVCDIAELCPGTGPSCPPDAKSTAECRASAGLCDVAELCDGVSCNCPADGFKPSTFECRPAAGDCDLAELCPGNGPSCPGDVFKPSSFECRPDAGECDVAELCPGDGPSCPGDACEPDGTGCTPDGSPCSLDECVSCVCEHTLIDPNTPPKADFIIIIDNSITMVPDLCKWVPAQLETFPAALDAAGIDWRISIIRTGTNEFYPLRLERGRDFPDLLLPMTNDAVAFENALDRMQQAACTRQFDCTNTLDCIRRKTEGGCEAINLALTPEDPGNPLIGMQDPNDLKVRPDALCNVIVYTDEDNDNPVVFDNGQPTVRRRREPPRRGAHCYGLSCQDRWDDFQQRYNFECGARLVQEQCQLNVIMNQRDRPAKHQYGVPQCSVEVDGRLDRQQTYACLIDPSNKKSARRMDPIGVCGQGGVCTQGRVGESCGSASDCNAFSLQMHLLGSGECTNQVCTAGRVDAKCASDFDCSILARVYPIPEDAAEAQEFFQDRFIPDKVSEQVCPDP